MKRFSSIILIDDDDIGNSLNKMVLEDMKVAADIETFSDAQDALNYLKNVGERLDESTVLVIVDFNMPSINGEEFVIKFKNHPSLGSDRIRIVIFSAYLPASKVAYLTTIGVDDFLEKPLSESKVLKLVERLGFEVTG